MRPYLVAAALPLAALALEQAHAESRAVPKEGAPYLSIEVPKGWSASYDDYGNLTVVSSDRSAIIFLSMIAGEETSTDYDAIAATILRNAQATPYSRSENGAAAGVSGKVYISTLPTKGGLAMNLRETLIRIDDTHIGSVAVVTQSGISADQTALLKAAVAQIHVAEK